jgi:hypothetical protein
MPEAIHDPGQVPHGGVRLRAILIGLLLLPPNAFWLELVEAIHCAGFPSCISLFPNVIFVLVFLLAVNALLKLVAPGAALWPGELLVVYVMLCLGTVLASHDLLQVVVGCMTGAFYYDTPENNWANTVQPVLPRLFVVRDAEAVRKLYEGHASLYTLADGLSWAVPVLSWCAFLTVLIFVMICINVIVRKEWLEYERLTFPIVTLPLEITTNTRSVFRSRLTWIGFGISAFFCILSGLNVIWPNVYALQTTPWNLDFLIRQPPWNAIGWLRLAFYPSIIGLSFFMPTDLQFSCWFFFWFWKVEELVVTWIGWRPALPVSYQRQQAAGAYIGIALLALWVSRGHLKQVLLRAIGRPSTADDSAEPMTYRAAALGIVLGLLVLMLFSAAANLPPWLAILFFVIYYAISTAVARMRATAGPPAHDLHFAGPDIMMPEIAGSESFQPTTLGTFAVFFGFNRGYRSLASAHSIEGFRMADRAGIANRRMLLAQLVAVPVAALAGFWALLHLGYHYGAGDGSLRWLGVEPFRRLNSYLAYPTAPDLRGLTFIGIGFSIVALLRLAQARIIGFPFHPIGFAISNDWTMGHVWFPIFLAWLCKASIIKYAGGSAYRKAVPFFIGLVLGEYIVGTLWGVLSIILDRKMYGFWP